MQSTNIDPAQSVRDPGKIILGDEQRQAPSLVQDITADEALLIALGLGDNRPARPSPAATPEAPPIVMDLSN